ncbi:MAG: class I poly(R)-hydroxyalkanoic acid synthase [Legionellaceae bacterium]|nr:class I poly(R)-hydroxyalkanoic acid synthase [Legionellaceae bacterium]
MTHSHEMEHLMQGVAEKSLKVIEAIRQTPGELPLLVQQFIDLTEDYQAMMLAFLKNPEQIVMAQVAYWQDAIGLWHEQMQHWLQGSAMPLDDRRFSHEEWQKTPFFNMLAQHYLLASEHFNTMLAYLDFGDPQLEKKIRFFSQQILDALSPANYLHTNPHLLAETIQSHGTNLLQGLKNLLNDLDNDSARLVIRMTDTEAFQVGENLATTAGQVIYRNEMMELIQYHPQTATVKSVPLLIIPPWINKYYILDLSAHNSLIRWLVEQGISVFVISWVNPDGSYRDKGMQEYLLDGPVQAIQCIQQQMDVPQVNTLGFCIGGTLQAMMLSYLQAQKKDWVKSATYLAAMLDFCDPGDISVFIDDTQLRYLEAEMNKKGYLDGRYMASTFNSLRANDLVWTFFVTNYLKGKKPIPFDLLYWNADCTNMPAKMHSEYLRGMYLNNQLIQPGGFVINDVNIDVTNLTTPSFFVSTEKDHIAPWKTVYQGFKLMAGPKRFLLGGSGHIAGIVNPPDKNKYHYYDGSHTAETPQAWLEQAEKHAGSWWPAWLLWLQRQSGRKVAARELSSLPLASMMDAPGSFVLMSCEKGRQLA